MLFFLLTPAAGRTLRGSTELEFLFSRRRFRRRYENVYATRRRVPERLLRGRTRTARNATRLFRGRNARPVARVKLTRFEDNRFVR